MRVLKTLTAILITFLLAVALGLLCYLVVINATILNPQFVVKEINKLDLVSLADNYLTDMLPSEAREYQVAIHNTLEQNQVWIKQQLGIVITDSYDYLLSKTDTWSIQVETKAITDSFIDNLVLSYEQSPPPDYAALSQSDRQQYIADIRTNFISVIPSRIQITNDDIPADSLTKIQQVRVIIRDLKIALFSTIAFCLLMILCLIMLFNTFKTPSRILGILFLVEGVFGTATFFFARWMTPRLFSTTDLPSALRNYLEVLLNDLLLPWGIFAIGLLLIGTGLLIFSFGVKDSRKNTRLIAKS
jgi:hypothetical protein